MPSIRKREFTDDSSKISTKTIEACNDLHELMQYNIEINGSITSVQMQLDAAKGKLYSDGEYANPEWWAKKNGYRKMLGFLSQKIQHRIREVKAAKNAASPIGPIFMDMARKILSSDQFNEILDLAKKDQEERLKQLRTTDNGYVKGGDNA